LNLFQKNRLRIVFILKTGIGCVLVIKLVYKHLQAACF